MTILSSSSPLSYDSHLHAWVTSESIYLLLYVIPSLRQLWWKWDSSIQSWSSITTQCRAVDLQQVVTPGDSAVNRSVRLQSWASQKYLRAGWMHLPHYKKLHTHGNKNKWAYKTKMLLILTHFIVFCIGRMLAWWHHSIVQGNADPNIWAVKAQKLMSIQRRTPTYCRQSEHRDRVCKDVID